MTATQLAFREHDTSPPASGSRPPASALGYARYRYVSGALLPLTLVGLTASTALVGNDLTHASSRNVLAGLLALTLLAAATGHPASTRLGLGLTATVAAGAMLPSQLGWWPLPGLVGVCVYVVAHLAARTDPTRDTAILRLGRLTAAHTWMVVGLAVSSGAVLLIFSRVAPPRLGAGASFLLDMTPWTLVAAGVTFAVVNALVEEVLFRGAVLHHLGRVLGNRPAVFVQALAFGMIHLNGYPHGLVGASLAAVYGLLLGALRLHTGGLLAPWLAHLCADVVIFALLVDAAGQAR